MEVRQGMVQKIKMPQAPASSKAWFKGMDSIRFILAFIVVLGHYDNPIVFELKAAHNGVYRMVGTFLSVAFSGVAAVVCFFIISGFVIHYPNKAGLINIKNFYIRRFTRVLIPLLVITLVSLPFGSPEKTVVWSLYCELVYYAVYPFLSKLPGTWAVKLVAAYVLCFIVIFVGASSDLFSLINRNNTGYSGEYWQLGNGLTWVIGLPAWLLGVNLANKIDVLKKRITKWEIWFWRMGVYSLSVILLVARFHLLFSYIISFSLFAVIFLKWLEIEILFFKSHYPYQKLENWGRFSYSLYLTHPLVFVIMSKWLALNHFTYFIYIGAAVLLSFCFYLMLERPSHHLAQRLSRTKQSLLPQLQKKSK